MELHTALKLPKELLAAAEDVKNPAMLLCGNHACGATLLHLGELVSANEHEERVVLQLQFAFLQRTDGYTIIKLQ
jgi:hypothetical protein